MIMIMNTSEFMSAMRTAATVKPLGDSQFEIRYNGGKMIVEVVTVERDSDDDNVPSGDVWMTPDNYIGL